MIAAARRRRDTNYILRAQFSCTFRPYALRSGHFLLSFRSVFRPAAAAAVAVYNIIRRVQSSWPFYASLSPLSFHRVLVCRYLYILAPPSEIFWLPPKHPIRLMGPPRNRPRDERQLIYKPPAQPPPKQRLRLL